MLNNTYLHRGRIKGRLSQKRLDELAAARVASKRKESQELHSGTKRGKYRKTGWSQLSGSNMASNDT